MADWIKEIVNDNFFENNIVNPESDCIWIATDSKVHWQMDTQKGVMYHHAEFGFLPDGIPVAFIETSLEKEELHAVAIPQAILLRLLQHGFVKKESEEE